MTIEAQLPATDQTAAYVDQSVECARCSTDVEVTNLCGDCDTLCCGCCEGGFTDSDARVTRWAKALPVLARKDIPAAAARAALARLEKMGRQA